VNQKPLVELMRLSSSKSSSMKQGMGVGVAGGALAAQPPQAIFGKFPVPTIKHMRPRVSSKYLSVTQPEFANKRR
jgi:hypothetical protein